MASSCPPLSRRLAIALGLTALAPAAHNPNLRTRLAALLPPGLNPAAIGAALQAQTPTPFAACLDTAGCSLAPSPAWLAGRVTEDFTTGRTLTVAGWHLSHTEAWLCAALQAPA